MSELEIGNGNGEVDGFSLDNNGEELIKKWKKLKGQNLSKSQKLSKSRKSLLKSGNSPNFGTTEAGPSFLIPQH